MKRQILVALTSYMLLSCASTSVQQHSKVQTQQVNAPEVSATKTPAKIEAVQPQDIVKVSTQPNKIQIAMAYSGHANFTGQPVPGYLANSCYLQKNAADALLKVAEQAALLGYQLLLLDCYRPQRASTHFMSWVDNANDQSTKAMFYPNLAKSQLKDGYIAAHSGHSRASTVDLTLLRKNPAGQWQQLDMGGAYDLFDPVSHLNSPTIEAQQKANRLLLKDLMQQQGFKPYDMEWWHFTLSNEKYPDTYFDFNIR